MIQKNKYNKDTLGGGLLATACLLAFMMANSPLSHFYDVILQTPMTVQVGFIKLEKPIILWINDGLMALFFLLVGLEIKREILRGNLRDPAIVIMPTISAICGVLIPALIYFTLNHSDPIAVRGWGIPVATDIAFSLALLSLLGKRIPVALKIFLTALAIIDDIAAIIIIALFYTTDLSLISFCAAAIAITLLATMNLLGVKKLTPYILVGVILWLSVLKSGVHATLAGILLAMMIPMEPASHHEESPLIHLEHTLLPWVTFFILPIFAFTNSGFHLSGLNQTIIFHPTTMGIIFGLVIGKQTGIFSSCWLLVKLSIGKLPEHVTWLHVYGMSLLCGVGFTMSLFIGSLAFENQDSQYGIIVRFGVLVGSLISAALGLFVLGIFSPRLPHAENPS